MGNKQVTFALEQHQEPRDAALGTTYREVRKVDLKSAAVWKDVDASERIFCLRRFLDRRKLNQTLSTVACTHAQREKAIERLERRKEKQGENSASNPQRTCSPIGLTKMTIFSTAPYPLKMLCIKSVVIRYVGFCTVTSKMRFALLASPLLRP